MSHSLDSTLAEIPSIDEKYTENGEITFNPITKVYTVWDETYADKVCTTNYPQVAIAALKAYSEHYLEIPNQSGSLQIKKQISKRLPKVQNSDTVEFPKSTLVLEGHDPFSKTRSEHDLETSSQSSSLKTIYHAVWDYAKQHASQCSEGYSKQAFNHVLWWLDRYIANK